MDDRGRLINAATKGKTEKGGLADMYAEEIIDCVAENNFVNDSLGQDGVRKHVMKREIAVVVSNQNKNVNVFDTIDAIQNAGF